jgi:hypothetical protein
MAFSPAAAQSPAPPPTGAPPEDCKVDPRQQRDGQAPSTAERQLSETLEKCRGVLQPPATGDGRIVEPAPDTGKTPVIPPGSVPEQPPAQPK